MDVYITVSTPPDNNYFPVDDLLDFSNDEVLLSSSSTSTSASASASHHHHPPLETPSFPYQYPSCPSLISTDFTDNLSVPSDDAAELEWLSQFVDDSFTDFPANSSLVGTINVPPETSLSGARARSKRSRGLPITSIWTSSPEAEDPPASGRSKSKKDMSRSTSPMTTEGGVRRCTHCASEKTPQWRTGPTGPKTLCNACGVRYKSGRLVPEYRPAASPTFVLTQHSNSHRKVLELRRQKEMSMAQQQEHQHPHQHQRVYHHHQHHDFEVC